MDAVENDVQGWPEIILEKKDATDHIGKALGLIDDSIRSIRDAHNEDIKIYQDLTLSQRGGGKMIANQGNIQINIVNQTVLLNLVELREILGRVSDADFLPTLNIKELTDKACRKALEVSDGNKESAGKLLGVTSRCIRGWLNGNSYRKVNRKYLEIED